MREQSANNLLCAALEDSGVRHVFGLPGSQNLDLFEAFRLSSIRMVVATHELAAGFMANGYYRSSGRPGVLTTIPGPGFAYSVAAIAEAAHDSAALLYIVRTPAAADGRSFALQSIDQAAILKPLVKSIVQIDRADQVSSSVQRALDLTVQGEPGPVLLHLGIPKGPYTAPIRSAVPAKTSLPMPEASLVDEAAMLLASSRRVLFYTGQGVFDAAQSFRNLAELLGAPVVTTRSGRGLIPEDHPLSLRFDFTDAATNRLNSLIEKSDLVIAVGCKLTHNGSYGFELRLPREKLIHVDASQQSLNRNYPAKLAIRSDARMFVAELLARRNMFKSRSSDWSQTEFEEYRRYACEDRSVEPVMKDLTPSAPAAFFAALRKAMPDRSILVTDSGLHQILATRYFAVQMPRGMIIPTDFQSMGFGLSAAIGARLAAPDLPIVALIGDGGFLMSAMEISTAVRERIPLTVIVFSDGALGQIRLQQLSSFGRASGVDIGPLNLAQFAASVGAKHYRLEDDAETMLTRVINGRGVSLVEVRVADSLAIHAQHAKGLIRNSAGRILDRYPKISTWRTN